MVTDPPMRFLRDSKSCLENYGSIDSARFHGDLPGSELQPSMAIAHLLLFTLVRPLHTDSD